MTVKAYAPANRDWGMYTWQPEDDYSWFDNVSYQWAENFFGQTGKFLARKAERATGTGTQFDALRDREVLEQAVGQVSQQELYNVMQQEITDLDEAVLSVRQEREAKERRERFEQENPSGFGTLTAGMVADLPLLLAEYALLRGAGPLLRYARPASVLRQPGVQEVWATGIVEYGSNAAIAAVSVEDTVEDAIVNGTLGTVFGATMISGIEGVRGGWGKYRTGKRMRDNVPLGAASDIPPSGPC